MRSTEEDRNYIRQKMDEGLTLHLFNDLSDTEQRAAFDLYWAKEIDLSQYDDGEFYITKVKPHRSWWQEFLRHFSP